MFLNDLYKIVELSSTAERIAATISLNPEHTIFEGHFPGSPVTPGVVQLQIVKELLEKQLERSLRMKTMRTCKFIQILNPRETPELNIHIKFTQSEFLEITAFGMHEGNTFFKAQIIYI